MLSTGYIIKPPEKAAVSYHAVMPYKPRKELMEKQESLLAKIVCGDKSWAKSYLPRSNHLRIPRY